MRRQNLRLHEVGVHVLHRVHVLRLPDVLGLSAAGPLAAGPVVLVQLPRVYEVVHADLVVEEVGEAQEGSKVDGELETWLAKQMNETTKEQIEALNRRGKNLTEGM